MRIRALVVHQDNMYFKASVSNVTPAHQDKFALIAAQEAMLEAVLMSSVWT